MIAIIHKLQTNKLLFAVIVIIFLAATFISSPTRSGAHPSNPMRRGIIAIYLLYSFTTTFIVGFFKMAVHWRNNTNKNMAINPKLGF